MPDFIDGQIVPAATEGPLTGVRRLSTKRLFKRELRCQGPSDHPQSSCVPELPGSFAPLAEAGCAMGVEDQPGEEAQDLHHMNPSIFGCTSRRTVANY